MLSLHGCLFNSAAAQGTYSAEGTTNDVDFPKLGVIYFTGVPPGRVKPADE